MALPIDVSPYSLSGVVVGDNYLTHYKAVDEDGADFIITEFYPVYMASRQDSGELKISARFTKEFADDRDEFVRRSEGFEEMQDSSLHPAVDVFERNNTAYLVRRACPLAMVEQFMGGQQMEHVEAYYFLRPLILSLAQAAEKGIFFNINFQDFRVNSLRQLVLCAPMAWDTDFHPTLTQIAKLYYRLVTGVEAADQGAPSFEVFGLELPNRLTAMIMEILNGEIPYGSIDDFYKQLKSLMDSATTEVDPNAGKTLMAVMRGVIAFLFILLAVSLVGLVYGAVGANRANSFWANPDIFVETDIPPPPPRDFSNIALTHPRSSADALSGSFGLHDGFLFMRSDEGMKRRRVDDVMFIPGAMGVLAAAEDMIIIENVRPSFIVGHSRHIYFIDIEAGGFIYRSLVNGGELTRVTEHAALNLAIVGDNLFYSNADENNYLYRFNIAAERHDLIFTTPVFATLANGNRLFFLAGEPWTDNSGLFVLDTETMTTEAIAGAVGSGGLSIVGDVIFYLGSDGRVRSVTDSGRPVGIHSPENVRNFDVFAQWIVFTEEGRHVPRAYNMDTGRMFTLSSAEWASYVWVREGIVYAIDHRNPNRVLEFQIPMG